MKPSSRVLNSLRLEPTDRIPVLPLVGTHSAEIAGIRVVDAIHNGEEMAKAVLFSLRKYGYDGVFPFMDLSAEAEAMGCGTREQEEGVPAVVRPALNSIEDLGRLTVPEPEEDERLPHFLKAVRILSEEVGGEVAVCAYITGPFTLASHLLGMTDFLVNCRRNPEALGGLLELTSQVGTTYGRALLRAGAQVIMILEPVAALISPAHFRTLVSPHISSIAGNLGRSVPLILHVCGNASHLVGEMVGIGVNGISIDAPVDIGLAREKTAGRLCIVGNVSPVKVMLYGSTEDVRRACEDCIRKGGERGFILSSGCEIPKKTPPENIQVMVKVAKEHRSKSSDES
jgi:uroporphyrinogen decarboxylase